MTPRKEDAMAEPRLPLAAPSDAELEQALTDLGRALTYPATPDLARSVGARLATEPATRPSAPWPVTRSRRVWLTAAILLLLLIGSLVLFPQVRTAIADRLGLRGVRIEWLEQAPTPAPVGQDLMLGRTMTLEEARSAVDFPLYAPTLEGFALPSEVYLSGRGDATMVSFVYPSRPGLPESDVAGVGALLTQFRGTPERNLIIKGLLGEGGEAETRLVGVTVGGHSGFWIGGAPHTVFFVCPDSSQCREERYRLAANVLLWEEDGLTLRLESALSQDAALAIAESVRPMS
jgi:hypothetical protein